MRDPEESRKVSLDYTMAAAQAFTQHAAVAKDSDRTNVRFVYLSGAAVERDQEKSLWMLGEHRKMRVSHRSVSFYGTIHTLTVLIICL